MFLPRFLGGLLAGLFVVGCASMLELDGYDDAVTLLCQCPGFEQIADCVGSANKRLNFSSDRERADWLEGFQDKQCDLSCERADECYGDVPDCRDKRPGCECCSWDGSKLTCTTGTCATCLTCSQVATKTGAGNQCISGRARYRELRQCACTQCSMQCGNFCQGTTGLAVDGSDNCSKCLANGCSTFLTACMADK
ncbi:MAG TPA: hypothetical protein PK156_46025 [Polyangium sp.]|nr:hypothetical protein [Polyangium sp.]